MPRVNPPALPAKSCDGCWLDGTAGAGSAGRDQICTARL